MAIGTIANSEAGSSARGKINAAFAILDGGGGLIGVGNNTAASAGQVGEYVESKVAFGSAVSVANATPTNVTSISLTAGDWDVEGHVNFSFSGGSGVNIGARASVSQTSATESTDGTEVYNDQTGAVAKIFGATVTRKRVALNGTTTVYLVGYAGYGAGAVTGFGFISARRVR